MQTLLEEIRQSAGLDESSSIVDQVVKKLRQDVAREFKDQDHFGFGLSQPDPTRDTKTFQESLSRLNQTASAAAQNLAFWENKLRRAPDKVASLRLRIAARLIDVAAQFADKASAMFHEQPQR